MAQHLVHAFRAFPGIVLWECHSLCSGLHPVKNTRTRKTAFTVPGWQPIGARGCHRALDHHLVRTGLFSKVLIRALTVFFPVLVNVLVGIRQVSQDLRDLMDSFNASKWEVLRYLEIPASLPVLLGGLRVGATLSVIGAIVGELVGSDRGLGYLINLGRGQYDTALVFVAVFSLILLAASLYSIVLFLERRALKWQTWQEI